jgi:hypothetical protein
MVWSHAGCGHNKISAGVFRQPKDGVRLHPEFAGNANGVDSGMGPPSCFIAKAMDFAMMRATQWNGEFVAYLAPERTMLRIPNVMRVRRLPATNQAGLLGHKAPVVFVPKPARPR